MDVKRFTRFPMKKGEVIKLGQPFRARGVGFGSDGNNLADVGIQLLVGVGPYGGGMHSDKEFMLLSSYRDRLSLMTNLIDKLLNSKGDSL